MDALAGTIARTYDGLDRLTEEQTPQGEVSYGYDNANRRTSMQVVGQTQVSYAWDNANRLTAITQGGSSVSFALDNANRRTCLTLPNGVIASYGYDQDSRVSSITYGTGGSCASPPSNLGNLSYTYDADGRRTSSGGSLAAVTLPTAVNGNTFNADNGMTGFNSAALSYDANGNLTSDGTNTYTWDARNHLTAISGAATASFVYDAFGRRASKTISGVTTQFLYDGLNPVQELAAGNPPASVTANLVTGLGIDEYFTRADSSGTMAFLADALGSTLALTDSSGSINTSYTYAPFGNTTVSGGNANPYQFTGRENDGTGLYYYRARYYSPTLQRFISQDPIDFGGGINLYAYTLNNPITLRDLLGLCAGGPTPLPTPDSEPNATPTPSGCGSPGEFEVAVAASTIGIYAGIGEYIGGAIGWGIGIPFGNPAGGQILGEAIGMVGGAGYGAYRFEQWYGGVCGP